MMDNAPDNPSTSRSDGENSLLDNFEAYTQAGYKKVQQGVIASQKLPEPDTFKLFKTYPSFMEMMKKEGKNILDTIQLVLEYTKISGRIGELSLEEKSDLVLEGNDTLLDRSTHNMDILEGFREPTTPIENNFHKKLSGTWNKPPSVVGASWQHEHQDHQFKTPVAPLHQQQQPTPPSSFTLHMAKVTTRPQAFFKDKINNQNEPWVPRIKEKPNNLKPLSIVLEVDEEGYESYSHPYEYELERWSPPPGQLERIPVVHRALPVEDTPYFYVETEEDLKMLMADLDGQNEIAVDLEHHSYRSFMGFTCLMQISTRTKDYVIDTLTLRDKLYVLNEIFTKPTVLKVFHGAGSDIGWLQRDLSLYVVNMFDTYQAAKVLQFPKLNLAYLLKKYCNIDANKHFQLYDWRTRPLSDNALKYARADTHYLLYIYSCMSNELLNKANGNTNLLQSVYHLSNDTCKQKYVKPLLEDDSHMRLYRKCKQSFNNRQMHALKRLYVWANTTARDEDESMGYVLPSHMMLQIAENLPREMQGILACCNPIPPLVRQHANTLHNIILEARNQPLVKVVHEDRVVAQPLISSLVGGQSLSDRLFDMKNCEFRDDLPTIMDGTLTIKDPDDINDDNKDTGRIWTDDPLLPIYQEDEDDIIITHSKKVMKNWNDIENQKLLKPYQRYKMVLPYVNQMEQEQRDMEEKEYREREQRRKEEEEERNRMVYQKDTISFSLSEQEQIEGKIEVNVPLATKVRKKKAPRKRGIAAAVGDNTSTSTSTGGGGGGEEFIPRKKRGKQAQKAAARKAADQSSPPQQQHREYGIITAEINTKGGGGGPNNKSRYNRNFTPFDYQNTNFNKFSTGRQQQQQQNRRKRRNVANNNSNDRAKNNEFGIKKSTWFKKKGSRGGHRQQH